MRFRSAGRRPDGRLILPLFSLLLLPGLPGGEGASPRVPQTRESPPSPDSILLWVFLSPGTWEVPGTALALGEAGARIRTRSDWLDAVSVALPVERVSDVLAVPGVEGTRLVRSLFGPPAPEESPQPGLPCSLNPPDGGRMGVVLADTVYGGLGEALGVLEVPAAHAMGFSGSGIRIGILDGLFLPDHATVRFRPPTATWDFVDDDGSVAPDPGHPPDAASHGTALWSLVAGDLPGVLRGGAPDAGVLLARVRGTGDLARVDEDLWVAGLEWLETQGARIVVSGFGFRDFTGSSYSIGQLDGDIAPSTRAADRAARRGVLVVAAVGNGGPGAQTLQAPSDGDSVLAVGAVSPQGMPAGFSAAGPTGDGREKPELMAPGVGLAAASAAGGGALEPVSGTEFAAALIAAGAALFVEAHPALGPMEVLEALSVSASQGGGDAPGVPRVASAILFPSGISPLPLRELDGEGRVTSLAPQFEWNTPSLHPVGLPVTFQLELAGDPQFQEVLVRDSVVGTFARRPGVPLPARTRLFWRVTARSVQGVLTATAAQGPFDVPSWVALDVLSDGGGTQVEDPMPEFSWTPVDLPPPAGPFAFDLQILSDRTGEVLRSHEDLRYDRFRPEEPLPFNVPLRWRVIARARTGQADTVTSAGPFVVTGEGNPPVTILYQNFPNPFPNPETGTWLTRIWFDLASTSTVDLAVYDLRGRLVRRLIPGPGCAPVELPPGLYGRDEGGDSGPCVILSWDGKGEGGRAVSPGVYLLRLRAGRVEEIRRMVYWP
jgi:hypothetical protein